MLAIRYAFRNLRKHLSFTIINLAGLALGIACALLIGIHILDELKYDRFHSKADRIYRITTAFNSSDGTNSYSNSATPLTPLLTSYIPEVEKACRVYIREAALQISKNDDVQKFREPNFFFADSSVFDVFSFEFLEGSPETSFRLVNSLVISEEMAVKYFGETEAVGKQVTFEGGLNLQVTGVIRSWPTHSHLQPDFIAPFDDFFAIEDAATADYLRTDWTYTPVGTYVLLRKGTQVAQVETKIRELVEKHSDDYARTRIGHSLQPLTSIRLYSSFSGDSSTMKIKDLYIIGLVGVLTLLVACFNFINLSIVSSLKRAKEAGIKKTLGADRKTLAAQFFTESGIVLFAGTLGGFILAVYSIPLLNLITGKSFFISDLLRPEVLALALVLMVSILLLACLYPSLYFSSANPVHTLKGNLSHSPARGGVLRRSLIVIQLGVSLSLLAATFVIYQQLRYIQNSPLGFQKENM